MTPAVQRAALTKADEAVQAHKWAYHAADNGGKTGSPPGMLQDDSRGLSRYLANSPHARQHVKEACQTITGVETS